MAQYSPTITNEAVNLLPTRSFDGAVKILSTPEQTKAAWEEITAHQVVGFDTETRPSFRKGKLYPVSLMQLAIPDKVFLIRLNTTGIDDEMIAFLENENIIKAGVGLQNDIKALQKLRPFKPNRFIELSLMTRKMGVHEEGIKKLAAIILNFRISKSAQTSNWLAPRYTRKQVRYASTDAWVCLCLYEKVADTLKPPDTQHYALGAST